MVVFLSTFVRVWAAEVPCLNRISSYSVLASFWEAIVLAIRWPPGLVYSVMTNLETVAVVLLLASAVAICSFELMRKLEQTPDEAAAEKVSVAYRLQTSRRLPRARRCARFQWLGVLVSALLMSESVGIIDSPWLRNVLQVPGLVTTLVTLSVVSMATPLTIAYAAMRDWLPLWRSLAAFTSSVMLSALTFCCLQTFHRA